VKIAAALLLLLLVIVGGTMFVRKISAGFSAYEQIDK
jgi:hypothetical protein